MDASDVLLAVWDAQQAAGLGGTADVVDHARGPGRRVTVIWPAGSSGGSGESRKVLQAVSFPASDGGSSAMAASVSRMAKKVVASCWSAATASSRIRKPPSCSVALAPWANR